MTARPQSPVRRVLETAVLAAVILLTGATLPSSAQKLTERANRGLVTIVTSSSDGTALRMVEDLSNVLDDTGVRRILPVVGKGSLRNLIDLRSLRGIDMALVQTDVLDQAKARGLLPDMDQSLTYVAKLYDAEFHLLTREDVHDIHELAGKKVNFGAPGDGTAVTARILFDSLKVGVQSTSYDPSTAMALLRSGSIDAVAFVSGKPAPLFANLPVGDEFHFLSIPLTPEILRSYLPARLSANDYPELVAADRPVDTVAIGTALMVVNFPQGSERYRNIADFVEVFLTQLGRLQEAPHHPKWNEVNLAAELPGWKRFAPAEAWLKHNAVAGSSTPNEQELRQIFSRFLDERSRLSNGKTLPTKEKDDLFQQFRHWQTSQVH